MVSSLSYKIFDVIQSELTLLHSENVMWAIFYLIIDDRPLFVFPDCEKSASELSEEQGLLVEIMKVVEKRDKLVSLLEEQRLKEKAEDRDLESMILSRGYQFHWSWTFNTGWRSAVLTCKENYFRLREPYVKISFWILNKL